MSKFSCARFAQIVVEVLDDADGKPTKLRYTELQVSPTLFTYEAEASTGGGPLDGDRTGQGYQSQIAARGFAKVGYHGRHAWSIDETNGVVDFV